METQWTASMDIIKDILQGRSMVSVKLDLLVLVNLDDTCQRIEFLAGYPRVNSIKFIETLAVIGFFQMSFHKENGLYLEGQTVNLPEGNLTKVDPIMLCQAWIQSNHSAF